MADKSKIEWTDAGMRGRASDELWACKEFPKEDADHPATVA